MALDYTTTAAQVRLLINDTTEDPVFSDAEITAFLVMEGSVVKLAAAQALDTIADDEALTGKVITTQDLTTNGPLVAAQLRERAATLRLQYASESLAGGALAPVGSFPDAPDDTPWR
jgi:hypothetical protein